MTLASQRNPIYALFSDEEIQAQYDAADKQREARVMLYDAFTSDANPEQLAAIDASIDEIDALLFKLDDELCARGH